MEKVCCIIDFEGFHVKLYNDNGTYQKKFLVRELAYVRIKQDTTYEANSVTFDLSKYKWETFTEKDKLTIAFQTKKIHGLSFYATPEEEAKDTEELLAVVRDIHQECCVPGVADTIAFKGGHVEKDTLMSLDIPDLNLQSYGCPKFKDLVMNNVNFSNSCGYHLKKEKIHCARAEVSAFENWLRKKLSYYTG